MQTGSAYGWSVWSTGKEDTHAWQWRAWGPQGTSEGGASTEARASENAREAMERLK